MVNDKYLMFLLRPQLPQRDNEYIMFKLTNITKIQIEFFKMMV